MSNIRVNVVKGVGVAIKAPIQPRPDPVQGREIGEPATLVTWKGKTPATVIDVFTHGRFSYVVVQEDRATRTDRNGKHATIQEYKITRNKSGEKHVFKMKSNGPILVERNPENGRFYERRDSTRIMFGKREAYTTPAQ
tara:strand:- start:258203 stop:258616 length:414 start_codon:yes stop_codon:yes gene_type:complete